MAERRRPSIAREIWKKHRPELSEIASSGAVLIGGLAAVKGLRVIGGKNPTVLRNLKIKTFPKGRRQLGWRMLNVAIQRNIPPAERKALRLAQRRASAKADWEARADRFDRQRPKRSGMFAEIMRLGRGRRKA